MIDYDGSTETPLDTLRVFISDKGEVMVSVIHPDGKEITGNLASVIVQAVEGLRQLRDIQVEMSEVVLGLLEAHRRPVNTAVH